MIQKAYAKINLNLDIIGKRKDNYHEVSMLLQSIDLYDTISIKTNNSNKINIYSDNSKIPLNYNNLAFKSAKLLFNLYNINTGIDINIDKKIPVAAGLGGGSSDAASVLIALNKLFELNISKDELINISSKIGSDVPFFIVNNLYKAIGTGTTLTKINSHLPKLYFLLIHPDFEILTKDMYEQIDRISKNLYTKTTDKLIKAIELNDLDKICENMKNTFEIISYKKYPKLSYIKDFLIKNNALTALMTGSGPTMYGVFNDKDTIHTAYNNAIKENLGDFIYITKPIYNKEDF